MDKETEKALDDLVDRAMDGGYDTNGSYTSMSDVHRAVVAAYEMGRASVPAPEATAWQDCTRCGAAILNKHPGSEPQRVHSQEDK